MSAKRGSKKIQATVSAEKVAQKEPYICIANTVLKKAMEESDKESFAGFLQAKVTGYRWMEGSNRCGCINTMPEEDRRRVI
jgi:hypothetical protein